MRRRELSEEGTQRKVLRRRIKDTNQGCKREVGEKIRGNSLRFRDQNSRRTGAVVLASLGSQEEPHTDAGGHACASESRQRIQVAFVCLGSESRW